jgi:hypothetical protein
MQYRGKVVKFRETKQKTSLWHDTVDDQDTITFVLAVMVTLFSNQVLSGRQYGFQFAPMCGGYF